jgi:hypothetical protein
MLSSPAWPQYLKIIKLPFIHHNKPGQMNIIRSIQNRIYEIRGERVMLDRDLAAL